MKRRKNIPDIVLFRVENGVILKELAAVIETAGIGVTRKDYSYSFFLELRRYEPEDIDFAGDHFGGKLTIVDDRGPIFYSLKFDQQEMMVILQMTWPYLDKARERVGLVFELAEIVVRNQGRKIDEAQKASRRELLDELQRLNKEFSKDGWLEWPKA